MERFKVLKEKLTLAEEQKKEEENREILHRGYDRNREVMEAK